MLISGQSWFYGIDIIIDFISLIALFLIGYFSINYYWIERRKPNYIWLSASFFLLGFSFVFKIVTNFMIYTLIDFNNYHIEPFTNIFESSKLPFYIGVLAYRIFMLIGLYILYSIYTKQRKTSVVLTIYLILVAVYFSTYTYYIFHLTSFILLLLISIYYMINSSKTKLASSNLLMVSFFIIALSQFILVFSKFNNLSYVAAELIQLIGYILLMITFTLVLRHGHKKK